MHSIILNLLLPPQPLHLFLVAFIPFPAQRCSPIFQHAVLSLCNHDPCKVIVFGQMLEGELSVINESLDASKKRNHLYRKFVAAEHGVLGHRVRIRIPECVIAFICGLVLGSR